LVQNTVTAERYAAASALQLAAGGAGLAGANAGRAVTLFTRLVHDSVTAERRVLELAAGIAELAGANTGTAVTLLAGLIDDTVTAESRAATGTLEFATGSADMASRNSG